ncbi:PLP-dependent transferase [Hortaea werneckii]|nr:PLP-dependent transferase [Hortaea werneckii]KAI7081371.1 PLP-dependent transferase [Hortaea werneckii]KAI7209171.1 PLP-dependent transferase [Hortaea werneckii]KAI7307231.1 PLP-dependent transferase [Hortaea werneckii]KAI7377539.1 PLP-dependent transferase [Hortaea werneckii]
MPGLPTVLPWNQTLGETIPPDTPHAVSVSLPTWKSNVGYEEGEQWVVDKMQTGYPRFFIHKSIQRLAQAILTQHGNTETENAMLVASKSCGTRCRNFLIKQNPSVDQSVIRILEFVPHPDRTTSADMTRVRPRLTAVIYPKELWPTAKVFWQHTGEGISSRQAEFCHRAYDDGIMAEHRAVAHSSTPRLSKGPKRYQRNTSADQTHGNGANGHTNGDAAAGETGVPDSAQFVEERFGRNLSIAFAAQAKLAIRKRIAGSLTKDMDLPQSLDEPHDSGNERSRDVPGFSVEDVYLYGMGMNAIFNAHRCLMLSRGEMPSVMYGFPYVDTLKVLEKFGPGATFYGFGTQEELDDLERRCENGEKYLSLFCEFPGNPLLKSPDLKRIRAIADKYDIAVVVDETIGNFLNIHVLPYADVVVSSLTKVFSGDSNVMGGTMILNPQSRYYAGLKKTLETEYEDNQFEEDSIYLERNSRDFVDRIQRINHNAGVIADVLRAHPCVKQVNYPKYSETKHHYDTCKLPNGGYGGLLSATFHSMEDAQIFYDHLDTHKGPSLGTNFTLSSPFVILAHYNELDWAAQFGCEASLIRFSVGLEDTDALKKVFEFALAAILEKNSQR